MNRRHESQTARLNYYYCVTDACIDTINLWPWRCRCLFYARALVCVDERRMGVFSHCWGHVSFHSYTRREYPMNTNMAHIMDSPS